MTLGMIRRLYAHLAWADLRVLDLMGAGTAARSTVATMPWPLALPRLARSRLAHRVQPAARLFAHVLAAERVWLLRLEGRDSSEQAIWPELALEEMELLAASNRSDYERYLAGLDEGDLLRTVTYTNQQGRSYETAIGDILVHVAMHGSYHRGQVALVVRNAGGDPVNTDYITFVRENPGGWEILGDPVARGRGVAAFHGADDPKAGSR